MADVAPGCGEAEIDRSTRRHAVIESLPPQRQTPTLLTANDRWFEMTGPRDDKCEERARSHGVTNQFLCPIPRAPYSAGREHASCSRLSASQRNSLLIPGSKEEVEALLYKTTMMTK
jgi:hypothetical protein